MTGLKIAALVLIIAGALGLAYGQFSYTKHTDRVELGPLELTVQDRETVNIPMWLGIGAIVAGGIALAAAGRGSRA